MEKRKILVIDDEAGLGFMIKLNLERAGDYDVRVETKGAQACAVIKEYKPDLILLDRIMPDMNGQEIVRAIAADDELKDIPVVFLTAALNEEGMDAEKGTMDGYPYLAKPVKVEELISCINTHLRQ